MAKICDLPINDVIITIIEHGQSGIVLEMGLYNKNTTW